MKSKMIVGAAAAAVILMSAVLLVPDKAEGMAAAYKPSAGEEAPQFVHGTADTPDGRTVIVSIFGNDPTYSWNFGSETDRETVTNINNYMGIAADFIEQTVSDYGKSAEFITDFQQNSDLFYSADFRESMTDGENMDWNVWDFIDSSIDTAALMKKYDADNLVFFCIVNTDERSDAITCTRNWYEGMERPYEIVYLYNIDSGLVNCPAVYAHEILHTFGAPDLYAEDGEFGIDSAVLGYVSAELPNEIMYTCSDIGSGEYLYDRVTNEISDLTAYYIGLTDSSGIAEKFELRKSEHLSE